MDSFNGQTGPRTVLIGSASVGKTSLITRIVENRFEDFTTPTTGTAFFQYHTNDPEKPVIQIWDTAGMERYRSLNRIFYHEAVAALLVFDLTNYSSFQDLESWYHEFMSEAPLNPTVILVGNKCDLSSKEVDDEEIRIFAKEHNIQYFQTSAVTGEGVDEMMDALVLAIPKIEAPVETNILPQDEKKKCC